MGEKLRWWNFSLMKVLPISPMHNPKIIFTNNNNEIKNFPFLYKKGVTVL